MYRRSSEYRAVWEAYHGQSIPDGWHIHHIDGNPLNNEIGNLMCVSERIHWAIHLLQGDTLEFIKNSSINAAKGGYATKGIKRKPMSEEHKSKISAAMKGKKKTPEHVKNASRAHREKKRTYVVSDETRRKLSEAATRDWAKRKSLNI